MFRSILSAAAMLMLAGCAGQPITKLTVAERFGLPRQDEPVRMGVPLAAGVVKDLGDLALADAAGKPVPCQFTEAMRWPDGSLRWVQVVFKASVPAGQSIAVSLVKGKPAVDPDKLTVAQADGRVTVQNAFVKLAVRGGGFNVFDSLAFDPAGKGRFAADLIKPHGEGVVADIDGKLFKSSLDKDSKVVVEEQGPECVVLKATGKLKDAAGQTALDYTCRIHAFAGSPMLKVDLSYTNCQGQKPADLLAIRDLSVVLPLAVRPTGYAIGGESPKVLAGPLKAGEAAEIVSMASDKSVVRAGGKEIGLAKGKSTKPLSIGWADAATADGGLAFSVRWFWQMFPKSLQVAGDGAVKIGLWSAMGSEQPLECYMGQGRTHYLTFVPHGQLDPVAVAAVMAPRQVPLRAVAPAEYYCRTSKAFGNVADSDPAIYPADLKELAKKYDAALAALRDKIVAKTDGCTYEGVTLDSYGYMAWGDLFHWALEKGNPDPHKILWESNYYDYPWACCLQFARTGDEKYLDITDPNGLNLADVFMCKWHPEERLRGACRYSPPANHVALDETKYQPYVSQEFNHHKAQSILARYLLLGDLQGRDHFMLALNNAVKNPEADWGQCRGPGAKLATLYEGYCLTGEKAVLDQMTKVAADGIARKADPHKFSKQGGSGYFMLGIAMEGMLYYQQTTGDARAADTVKAVCDFLMGEEPVKDKTTGETKMKPRGLQGSQLAYPLAFTFRATGEQKYRDAAVKQMGRFGGEPRPKNFGMSWRSTPYAWFYLSTLADKQGSAK